MVDTNAATITIYPYSPRFWWAWSKDVVVRLGGLKMPRPIAALVLGYLVFRYWEKGNAETK